jgi:hypothetical protein
VCVALAALLAVARLDEALGLYDFRADTNASLGYLERAFADDGIVVSRAVVQDAAAWIPPGGSYRVVLGRRIPGEHRFTRLIVEDFLRYYLFPRRQTASRAAPWVLCFGCDTASLGPRFQVLSDNGNRVVFGRAQP